MASLEQALADITARLLLDEISAKAAIEESESLFRGWSHLLCQDSQQFLCRPARRMHLLALSEEMDQHAATWHLLWCLHCSESAPVGIGGPIVTQTGGKRTRRQALTDTVLFDRQLTRVASVVSWLESLADDMLKRNEGDSRGPSFASKEGLWAATFVRSGYDQHISEMDPDAPTRQMRSLHPDNAKAEARLMQRMWELIRAGRVAEACGLCTQVGQPWRAASLSGCGAWGPLPVGMAAGALDEFMSEAEAAEELSGEVEGGTRAGRELWKLTCRRVAAQASGSVLGGDFEAAVYGAMCGDLRYMMPVCASWEDGCWMLCRAWLQERCDDLSAQLDGGGDREQADLEMASSHVMRALLRCGAGAALTQAAVQEVARVSGRGPDPVQQSGGVLAGAYRIPTKFAEVFVSLDTSPVPRVSSSAATRLRQTQRFLIEDGMHPLTQHLHNWLVMNGRSADDSSGMGGGDGAGALPPPAQRNTAVAAHLLLLLEALGVLTGAVASESGVGGMAETEADLLELNKTSTTSQQLVALHAVTLLERGHLSLVPQYLCHLRDGLREALSLELLTSCSKPFTGPCSGEQLSAACDTCIEIYHSLSHWFTSCVARQQRPSKDLNSFLVTDIRGDELQYRLLHFLSMSRFLPSYGADARVQLARWLILPCMPLLSAHLERQHQDTSEDPQGPAPYALDMWHVSVFIDALELLNALSCELALGNQSTAEAGHAMYDSVIPEGFEQAAFEVAQALSFALSSDEMDGRQPQASDLASLHQLHVLTSGARQWRAFFVLDRDSAAWTSRHEALQQGGAIGVEDVVQEGTSLLHETMKLLRCGWLADVSDPASSPTGPAAELFQMDLTFTAHSTPASDPSQARGAADAQRQGAGGSLPQSRLGTGVGSANASSLAGSRGTVASAAAAAAAASQTAGRSYPLLQGAHLLTAVQDMQTAVAAELNGSSGVAATVEGPLGSAQGVLVVRISCSMGSQQAWQRAVSLAASLVQSSIPGQPSLLLVNLRAAAATAAAISRRCCLSQAVMRCAALRVALVTLRADPSTGSDLVELLAGYQSPESGVSAGQPMTRHDDSLLGMLSPSMLQQVLRLEADTQVAAMQNEQQGQSRGSGR
ncbi:MAG: hypothetical protein WDW36_005920 [Sanguina aurantia]